MTSRNTRIKLTFVCPVEEKALFPNSSCSVTVSIGNKEQEGAKLAATIRSISDHFKECTIMVCDSLQRHNMLELPESIAYEQANENGKSWIEQNEKYFLLFSIPYKIRRWDDWFFSNQYHPAREKIDNLFAESEWYRKAFFCTVDDFLNRSKKRRCKNFDDEIIAENSLEYLKEECAVMLLWAENGYNFEIYPSKRNPAMAATYEYFIKPLYRDVLKSVSLDIRTRRMCHANGKEHH